MTVETPGIAAAQQPSRIGGETAGPQAGCELWPAHRGRNVNQRQRIPESAILAVVEHIARKFQPDKIVLFGSYAYGQPKPGSDVDLLVVMDTPDGDWPPTLAILRSLSPFRFGVDVIVRSQAEIERRIKLGDWFMEDVVTKGKVLYERPHG